VKLLGEEGFFNIQKNIVKKSNLYYTRLILFECHEWAVPIFAVCARAHTSRLQRRRVVGNV